MELEKSIKHIMLYGIAMACLILLLKWMQWSFLIKENAIDVYIGMIALLFTFLGVWIASQLIKPKTQTIIVEKEIIVHQPKKFVLNKASLESLRLTEREFQILQLIAKGHNNSDIAKKLFLSLSTIKTHVSNLYSKMNVKNRYKAIAMAKKMEIVE